MSRQSSVKVKGFYVATENFCVAIEFPGVVSRQSIMSRQGFVKTKRFYVATKNSMSRHSCLKLCHDKVYLAS